MPDSGIGVVILVNSVAAPYAVDQLADYIYLEVSMGVAQSDAEIYAARKNQLRVELAGGGEVVTFRLPNGGDSAESLEYKGYVFKRIPKM